ncbi:MAG: hypothetical protein ACRDI1_04315, partial [Actinomycetota bacterium]
PVPPPPVPPPPAALATDALIVWNEDGLHAMNPDGSGLRLLIPGEIGSAVWSPDRSLIAYTHGTGGIRIAAADGTGVRKLTQGHHATWSPSGGQIGFKCTHRDLIGSESAHICVIDSGGGTREDLTPADQLNDTPAWSARRVIAFRHFPDNTNDPIRIEVMEESGEGRKTLLELGEDETATDFDWAPDGSALALSKKPNTDVAYDIWTVDAGGPLRQLTSSQGVYELKPSYSPHGSRIAFLRHAPYSEGAPPAELWIMGSSGEDPKPIPGTTGFYGVDW